MNTADALRLFHRELGANPLPGLHQGGTRTAHHMTDPLNLAHRIHVSLIEGGLGCVNDLGQFLGLLIRQRWLLDGGR